MSNFADQNITSQSIEVSNTHSQMGIHMTSNNKKTVFDTMGIRAQDVLCTVFYNHIKK